MALDSPTSTSNYYNHYDSWRGTSSSRDPTISSMGQPKNSTTDEASTSRLKWTKTARLIGLPVFAPHCPAFQLIAFIATCPGINPLYNLSLAGVRPDYLFRPEIRYRLAEFVRDQPGLVISKEELHEWVGCLVFFVSRLRLTIVKLAFVVWVVQVPGGL